MIPTPIAPDRHPFVAEVEQHYRTLSKVRVSLRQELRSRRPLIERVVTQLARTDFIAKVKELDHD